MQGLSLRQLSFGARLLVPLLAALIFIAALFGGQSHADTPARPNVVMIMTDDQRLADLAFMPKTLALIGAKGVTFDNAYVSDPLCCPSRATYLTGQYVHNHGVKSNDYATGGYRRLDGDHTLPLWLQNAVGAYRTGHVGKYLNGYGISNPVEVPRGWDEWYGSPSGTHFRMFDYQLNCQVTPPPAPDCGGLPSDPYPEQLRSFGTAADDYKTDVESTIADDFIARNSVPGHQPFFLSIAPIAPHIVYPGDHRSGESKENEPQPAPRHAGRFGGLALPTPPSFNERDVSDKPRYVRSRSSFSRSRMRAVRDRYRLRVESLMSVDDMVEQVVETLESVGELDNTYIFFTTDNGYMQGEHRLSAGKIVPYEESIHVPLLVRGPGVPQGEHRSQLVGNVDLAPTIADIGGAIPDLAVDGLSILPAIEGNAPLSRSLLLENFDSNPYRGIRVGRWAYVKYNGGETELYDLHRDPFELRNLAARRGSRAQRARLRRLGRLLGQLRTCSGTGCLQPPPALARKSPKSA